VADQYFVMPLLSCQVTRIKPEQKATVIIISLPDTTVASKAVLFRRVHHNTWHLTSDLQLKNQLVIQPPLSNVDLKHQYS